MWQYAQIVFAVLGGIGLGLFGLFVLLFFSDNRGPRP